MVETSIVNTEPFELNSKVLRTAVTAALPPSTRVPSTTRRGPFQRATTDMSASCVTGIVLSATAGALGKMLLPFKLGAGGPIGGGKQWMSWISLDDEIYAINHLMMNADSKGVYNLTSPNPIF